MYVISNTNNKVTLIIVWQKGYINNNSTILGLHSCGHKYMCSKFNPLTVADLAYYKYAIMWQFNQQTHSSLKIKRNMIE